MTARTAGILLALGWALLTWAAADGLALLGVPESVTWRALLALAVLAAGFAYLWAFTRDPALQPPMEPDGTPSEPATGAERAPL